jgi:chromosome segregation ATPase
MSQQAAVSTGSERRTIGAILRSHGYVTDAQLDEAAETQSRTGKPLGQVLVEAGTITRLELASALAEQWSDSSEWMHNQDGATLTGAGAEPSAAIGLAAPRHAPDDGVLASRLSAVEAALQDLLRSEPAIEPLEHAVADLARRVTSWEPTLAEFERQAHSAVDVDSLEAQLGDLAAGIEGAVRRSDATAESLADFSGKLDELYHAIRQSRENTETASDAAAAETARIAAAVARLEERKNEPTAGEPPVTAAEMTELRRQLAELSRRPTADHEQHARLDDLSARIDDLAARPTRDTELAERVEHLGRLVSALDEDPRLDAVQSRIAELAARPIESPELVGRLDDLSRRVDALVAEAGAHVQGEVPDELRAALEELATRPPVDAALAARVEELAQKLAELPDHGNGSVDPRVDELTNGMELLAGRLSELERNADLRALAQTVEELAGRPVVEAGLGDRVWRLAERIDELSDAVAARPGEREAEVEIAALRAAVDSLAARPAGDPDRLDTVGARLDEAARQIEDLSRTLADVATARQPAASPDEVAGLAERLDELAYRVADLSSEKAAPVDTEALSTEIESRLAARLDERLADRPTDPDPATESLAADLSRNAELWYAGRAALEARIEELEAKMTARPVTGVAGGGGTAELVPHVFEQEVERVLMAVERLGLHLSEHDRALAELMSRRGSSKVEELEARVDELETYGVAAGAVVAGTGADGAPAPVSMADTRDLRGELRSLGRQLTELEDSSKADREKFLTQLERMASSIDWRIRRIESGETGA